MAAGSFFFVSACDAVGGDQQWRVVCVRRGSCGCRPHNLPAKSLLPSTNGARLAADELTVNLQADRVVRGHVHGTAETRRAKRLLPPSS